MKTVLVYGDSNTYGSGPARDLDDSWRLDYEDRWVTILGKGLGPDVRVIDEGMPGRTTCLDDPFSGEHYNGLRVLPAILSSHAPVDLLVVMLGTNDIQHHYGFRPADVARALESYVDVAQGSGKVRDILILSPAPVLGTGTYADSYTGALQRQAGMADAIEQMTLRRKVGFFDVATVAKVSPIDGVHFDAENSREIGAAMINVVKAAL
ncbi:MAG: GDSL-type esterase/lipase family protein [Planktomarina sp.]